MKNFPVLLCVPLLLSSLPLMAEKCEISGKLFSSFAESRGISSEPRLTSEKGHCYVRLNSLIVSADPKEKASCEFKIFPGLTMKEGKFLRFTYNGKVKPSPESGSNILTTKLRVEAKKGKTVTGSIRLVILDVPDCENEEWMSVF